MRPHDWNYSLIFTAGGPAGIDVQVSPLDLQRGVLDAKPVVQLAGDLPQQLVLVGNIRHHQVGGEGDLCSAEAPDVHVVNFGDSGQPSQVFFHGTWIDPFGNRI